MKRRGGWDPKEGTNGCGPRYPRPAVLREPKNTLTDWDWRGRRIESFARKAW